MLSGTAETPAPPPAPAPPAPPAPPTEPELTPFSLEDLGLSAEEIASLGLSEEVSASVDNTTADDIFDFDVVEERPVEKAVRTAPRIEEPPPPPPTQDTGFTPEPLDSLDTIWDVPVPVPPVPVATAPVALPPVTPPLSREKSDTPSRAVLPPLGERERTSRIERREPPPARPRDDDRYARREPPPARPRDDDRYARREPPPAHPREDLYARREEADRLRDDRSGRRDYGRSTPPARAVLRRSFGSFVPTGDDSLDEYLIQIETEPDNYGMALSLARLSAQTGRIDLMTYTYKHLIRGSHALEVIIEDVPGLIETVDDQAIEQQLYRVLGDALAKQGRLRDAMAAYNHTFGG